MAKHHYVLGAGQVGCLYDFGPEAYETLHHALEAAEWYLSVGDADTDPVDVEAVKRALRRDGIHYFTGEARAMFGDYIEISKCAGPMPEDDEASF